MIKPSMIFYNFRDFYNNGKKLKEQFELLSVPEKRIYKMYVYSNRLIRENLCDKIWEYLNEPFGSMYYVSYDMLGLYL